MAHGRPHGPHAGGYPSPKPKPTLATTAQSGGYQHPTPVPSWDTSGADVNINVGYGEGQVDPGLAAHAIVASGAINEDGTKVTLQQAQQQAQGAMGSTGIGFGIGSLPPVAATTQTPIVEEIPEEIPPKKKGAIETLLGSTLYGQVVGGMLSGPQATSNFFKKLASGEELTPEDKIILANLMAADKKGANVFGDTVLDEWMEKFDVTDKKGFKSSLDEAKKDLASGVKLESGETISYEDLIYQYETGKPTGLGGIFGLGEGERTGGITREELKKKLGKEGIAYLKANDPAKYYSFIDPQTTGSLEELANLHVTDTMQGENPDLVRKIFEARQTLGTEKKEQEQAGQGGGAGITGLPGIPPDLVQQPITTQPDLSDVVLGYGPGDMAYTGVIPREGYQYTHDAAGNRYEIPVGGDTSGTTYGGRPFTFREGEPWQAPVGDKLTTATATTPMPFNYSQWPQFGPAGGPVPNYVNQGLGQGPQFDYWNSIANAFPGMR